MSNKLKINQKGNLLPKQPARSYDKRNSLITPPTTNMNAAPLFYIGPRVNTLSSSPGAAVSIVPRVPTVPTVPTAPIVPISLGIMRYGSSPSGTMNKVYGNIYNSIGNQFPNRYPNLNLSVDLKGNYKLVNEQGKSYRLHYDSNGRYVKHNKNKFYL